VAQGDVLHNAGADTTIILALVVCNIAGPTHPLSRRPRRLTSLQPRRMNVAPELYQKAWLTKNQLSAALDCTVRSTLHAVMYLHSGNLAREIFKDGLSRD